MCRCFPPSERTDLKWNKWKCQRRARSQNTPLGWAAWLSTLWLSPGKEAFFFFLSIQMQWRQSRWQIWCISNSNDCISPPWGLSVVFLVFPFSTVSLIEDIWISLSSVHRVIEARHSFHSWERFTTRRVVPNTQRVLKYAKHRGDRTPSQRGNARHPRCVLHTWLCVWVYVCMYVCM